MNTIILATDADWLAAEVTAALLDADSQVNRVSSGRAVATVVGELAPDLVVLDMQIGSQGGIATCLDLLQDFEIGRLDRVPIMLLLDRQADEFLAQESGADAWVVKPINSLVLKRLADGLLAGS